MSTPSVRHSCVVPHAHAGGHSSIVGFDELAWIEADSRGDPPERGRARLGPAGQEGGDRLPGDSDPACESRSGETQPAERLLDGGPIDPAVNRSWPRPPALAQPQLRDPHPQEPGGSATRWTPRSPSWSRPTRSAQRARWRSCSPTFRPGYAAPCSGSSARPSFCTAKPSRSTPAGARSGRSPSRSALERTPTFATFGEAKVTAVRSNSRRAPRAAGAGSVPSWEPTRDRFASAFRLHDSARPPPVRRGEAPAADSTSLGRLRSRAGGTEPTRGRRAAPPGADT